MNPNLVSFANADVCVPNGDGPSAGTLLTNYSAMLFSKFYGCQWLHIIFIDMTSSKIADQLARRLVAL